MARRFVPLLALGLTLGLGGHVVAQQRIVSQVHLSAMPTWIYNGFTRTGGDAVQGSDVSPIRTSFGAGVTVRLGDRFALEPEAWIYVQEYIALDAQDKVVPTQLETGSAVGDIARTVSLALSAPVTLRFPIGEDDRFSIAARAGMAAVLRIPYRAIDGSETGPVGSYWATRFLYPQIGFEGAMRLSPRVTAAVGSDWYIPLYNAWTGFDGAPFLDETMVRTGLRVRWSMGRASSPDAAQ